MKHNKSIYITIVLIIVLVISVFFVKPEKGQAEINKFNMSYLYFGDVTNHIKLVENTKDSLDVISPNYFNINADGTLQITSLMSVDFIDSMHKKKIKVVPFISNHWDRQLGRIALENREELVDEIVEAIEKYKLDGINVDIENVTEIDRDNYTDFVKLLREKLPQDKEVSVAVAANPMGLTKGWHGSYDYEALAKYSDYLMIMAYDESYYGGEPGPVASKEFVENSILFALTKVSSDKIVLGIPFYGRFWNSNEKTGGNGISLTKVDAILKSIKSEIFFDKTAMSPYASFTIETNDQSIDVNGKILEPGNYTIWYENEESIKEKIQLVHKYDLKGTGSWALGQELTSTWDYYELWLNKEYFDDIEGNWAKDDILSIAAMGWMKGTSKTSFSPAIPITRAQAAATLVRALELEDSKVVTEKIFIDLFPVHWAYNEIQLAVMENIFIGYGDGKFDPDEPLTREQMAVLLNRVINKEKETVKEENPFTDVKDGWAYDSIIEMNSLGVFKGFSDNTFRPKEKMSRAEMAAVLNRIKDLID